MYAKYQGILNMELGLRLNNWIFFFFFFFTQTENLLNVDFERWYIKTRTKEKP